MDKKNKKTRRNFIKLGAEAGIVLALGSLTFMLSENVSASDTVWQIDPDKCTQCGRCADECVLKISAVKCVHAYKMCGYCNLCGGYFRPNTMDLNTGAENQLCPTAAIKRTFIEDPYFKYDIDEDLCIGCAKCVAGCGSFGNGSLHLQIRHDICKNCNQCAIARVCPSNAINRISADTPYLIKGIV